MDPETHGSSDKFLASSGDQDQILASVHSLEERAAAEAEVMRVPLRELLVALVAALITLLAAELFLWSFPGLLPADVRVHFGLKPPPSIDPEELYAPDALIEHHARPGMTIRIHSFDSSFDVRTNALPGITDWGWRNAPYRPGVALDWLVIGDSFAFGFGVAEEEGIAGRLAAGSAAAGLQTWNAGLSNMTGTLQQERILERILEHHRPRRVLVLHCENDYLEDNLFESWVRIRELAGGPQLDFPGSRRLFGTLIGYAAPPTIPLAGPRTLLARSSATWNLAKKAIGRPPYRRIPTLKYQGATYHCDLNAPLDPPELEQRSEVGFELGAQAFRRMAARLHELSIPAVVLFIPSKWQLLLPGQRTGALPQSRRERMIAECQRSGWTVIDPFSDWVDRIRREQIYFPADTHWTARGHEQAARLVESASGSR
jgi:hypothetical protein